MINSTVHPIQFKLKCMPLATADSWRLAVNFILRFSSFFSLERFLRNVITKSRAVARKSARCCNYFLCRSLKMRIEPTVG